MGLTAECTACGCRLNDFEPHQDGGDMEWLPNRKERDRTMKIGRKQKPLMAALLCIALAAVMAIPAQAGAGKKAGTLIFTRSTKKLTAGKTYQFRVNTTEPVIWSVGNEKTASVSSTGKVTARRYGRTHVYADCGGEKISVLLQVNGKKVIGIDPGHQERGDSSTEPNGPGSSTYKAKVAGGTRGAATGKPEYKLTLEVAKKLKAELMDRGYQVVMTRTKNNVNISNKERALLVNESGADICVRIHADGGASSARGASVLCPSSSNRYISKLYSKSKKLSAELIGAYCKETGLRNRGISYRDDLTGTNWSTVPTTLIELGFMTNSTEDRFMASASGQKKMVKGLADGIDAYFGY